MAGPESIVHSRVVKALLSRRQHPAVFSDLGVFSQAENFGIGDFGEASFLHNEGDLN